MTQQTDPVFDIRAAAHIEATAEAVYEIASDITRMGEWSPECTGGEWISGTSGAVGSRFHGHNRAGEHEWTTECEVVAAEPGRRFAWGVVSMAPDADTSVWSFEVEPEGDGCRLTQRFVMREVTEGLRRVQESLPPERMATFLNDREAGLTKALQHTVDGIKRTVEQS